MTSGDHGTAGDAATAGPTALAGPSRGPAGWAFTLRLHRRRWDGIDTASPKRGLTTVVGGWLLLAFGRFGILGLTAPRPVVRFILVGVYVWLLMAGLVWLIAWLARLDRTGFSAPGATRCLQLTGLAHQPLVVLGLVLLLGQVIPTHWPFTVAAALALAVWLPGMLVAALTSAFGGVNRWSLGAALAAYLAWAVLAGRYLLDRVGHLF